MKRVLTCLIAVIALGSAGWFGIHALSGSRPLASVPIPIKAAENLPDAPAEWRGRIDYSALDRQLADLAQRPEMAGLAVAVVEDGKLSFVRTYGVADAATGVPVTPHTLFRWASVSKTAAGALAGALAAAEDIYAEPAGRSQCGDSDQNGKNALHGLETILRPLSMAAVLAATSAAVTPGAVQGARWRHALNVPTA